jgi:lysophospholipase L1-like esterase
MKPQIYFLLLLFIMPGSVLLANKVNIVINNKTKELIAPDARDYQWYVDGIKITGANSKKLKPVKSGAYTLETTDNKGRQQKEQINIIINAAGNIIRIYTIGDSTVQNYTAGFYPRTGWGQVLQFFFKAAEVTVINKAVGGTSSKSYYNLFWPAVKNALVAGDYVFIQFGINDRNSADPARYAPTGGVFEGYLTKFVNEARAKGAIPVLVSTIRRNSWKSDGTPYDAYHDHPIAVRTVAASLNVPLIDLDARAKVLLQSVGQTYSTNFWYNHYDPGEYPNYPNGAADDVHFQEMGAIEMAKLITDGINALNNDARVSGLIPHLYNQHRISTSANFTSAGLFTHNTTYPPGVKITLKARPATGHSFVKWTNASGVQVTTGKIFTFTMGTSSSSYKAFFDNNLPSAMMPSSDIITDKDLITPASSIYPNPFTSQTTIQRSGTFSYKIISVNGIVVESGTGFNTVKIGKSIGAGLFTVIVQTTGNHQLQYKIIKQ